MKSFGNHKVWMATFAVVTVSTLALYEPTSFLPWERPERNNIYQEMMRFSEALNAVSKYYVEEVKTPALVDGAISGMLETLDPHSVFIPRDQLEDVTEKFEGHFFGIGIEFLIIKKWPTVIAPIGGSPSERLGLRAGDQIVQIDGKSSYNLNQDEIIKQLRGPRGSQVKITIQRPGFESTFDVTITRDKISIYSVEPVFMIDDQTGYIGMKRFSKTTAEELENALLKLEAQGLKQLILDLRSNAGGYLDQAVEVADKFIERGRKIVYTRGRIPQADDDYLATDDDHHKPFPTIILIDHGSASASEIVAGAMQDWDRALIVGETSFGKGLVQTQIGLKDGSAIRVTTAKYYTPSGRLIQRPYENGHFGEYVEAAYDDVDPNTNADSLKNRPVYQTSSGRKVFGGGGITPDVQIKWLLPTHFTVDLIVKNVFLEYAGDFASKNRQLANNFEAFKEIWAPNERMMADFRRLLEAKNIKFDLASWNADQNLIKLLLKKEVALHLWDRERAAQVEVHDDPQFAEVLRLFPQAEKLAALNDTGGRLRKN
ncbi:S41 family peptidase [candidate division KSB1 bacterium]|nr:MAG: S41 family peptidase [candidate division KSB1 bacterium]MBC6949450.1 S41 family peptidase [candidate division KSB1 bacterium]MCE7940092.1 S41 family peptidase [Chlorobi bacterium CHB1]